MNNAAGRGGLTTRNVTHFEDSPQEHAMKLQQILLSTLVCSILLITATTTSMAAASGKNGLTFGVVPQHSTKKVKRLWTPIIKYISALSGIKLKFETAPSIPEFEKQLAESKYDIAYMNPYHYTVFHKSPGYTAFAKQKDKQITGIVVVRKDSPYKTIYDLKDKTLAFPSPAAFAASVLPQTHFKGQKININPEYVSSYDNVYRAVVKGKAPAGGGVMRTLNTQNPNINSKLRVLWTTKRYTPHAIAAHPRVDKDMVDRIFQAMSYMHEDREGIKLLSEIRFNGIEAATDKDWNDIRGLGITLLDELTKKSK